MQAVTRVNAEQTSKRTMRRPTRPPYRGRLIHGLLAELRLLANNHVPTYHVVVGDVIGADKVAAAFDKLGSVEVEAVSQLPLWPDYRLAISRLGTRHRVQATCS